MLRLKRKGGGEVNIAVDRILSFINGNNDEGSTILIEGGLTYEVEQSPQSIRTALKKLGFDFN